MTYKRTCAVARVGGAATGADVRVATGWDDKDSSSLARAALERSSPRAVRIRASRAVVQRH